MTSTRRALSYNAAAQFVSVAVQFLMSVAVARLLLPEEVGVFAIAAVSVFLGRSFADLGAADYLIVERDLTSLRIRAAIAVTLLVGWSLALFTWLVAPLLGNYYDSPGVTAVMQLLALNFVLAPFVTIPAAMLKRDMAFGSNSIAHIASSIVQGLVTVLCAVAGLSYMSMAWGAVAGTLTSLIVINSFRPAGLPWLPGLAGIRPVLRFGTKAGAIAFLRQVSSGFPELVVGKALGMHAAGLYSRTIGTTGLFAALIVNVVNPVLTPHFAKTRRDNADVGATYLYVTRCLTGLAWAFFGVFFFLSPYFVRVLFGPNWMEIVPYLQILCLGSLSLYLTSSAENLFTAVGRVDLALRLTAIMSVAGVIAISLAALLSLTAVVWVSTLLPLLRILISWRDIRTMTGTDLHDHLRIVFDSALLALPPTLVAAAVWLWDQLVAGVPAALLLFIGVAGSLGALGFGLMTGSHPLRNEVLKFLRLWRLQRRSAR